MAGVNVCGRGSGLWQRQGYMAGVGTCGRVWVHVAGVGACGRGGGRVWGHVAGVGVCGRGSGLSMDGDMWQRWGHVVGHVGI